MGGVTNAKLLLFSTVILLYHFKFLKKTRPSCGRTPELSSRMIYCHSCSYFLYECTVRSVFANMDIAALGTVIKRWSLSQSSHPEIQDKNISIGCWWATEKSAVLRNAFLENMASGSQGRPPSRTGYIGSWEGSWEALVGVGGSSLVGTGFYARCCSWVGAAWGGCCDSGDQGEEIREWLSWHLGIFSILVRCLVVSLLASLWKCT